MKFSEIKVGDFVEISCYNYRYRVKVTDICSKTITGDFDTPEQTLEGKWVWSKAIRRKDGCFVKPTQIKKLR